MTLADRWRAARPAAAGVHLDSAACSRQSVAVIEACAHHARHEAEVGGYVAAQAAAPALDAGRAAVRALTGMADADVEFTTGSNHALDILLSDWTGERTVACLPGEYGPNLAIMARHGFDVRVLPADEFGRLDVNALGAALAYHPPALVHLTVLGSHSGIVQPLRDMAGACHGHGIPLIVDAAQGFAHIDIAGSISGTGTAAGVSAVYSSSRKWAAGPRGVGVLATRPGLLSAAMRDRLAHAETNIGLQVGFSVALGEYLAMGADRMQERLRDVGAATRTALAEVGGWRVVEHVDEPSAITTAQPPEHVDAAAVRMRLIDEYGIVTTFVGTERAPRELDHPALRLSPHVDVTDADLAAAVSALNALTRSA